MSNPKLRPKVIKVAEITLTGALKKVDDTNLGQFSYISYAGVASNDYGAIYSVASLVDSFDRAFGVTRITSTTTNQEFTIRTIESYLRKNLAYGTVQVYTEFDETDPILIEYALLKITGQQIIAVAY